MPPKRRMGPAPGTPPPTRTPQFISPGTEAAAALLLMLSRGSKRFLTPGAPDHTGPPLPVSREMAAWQSGIDGAAADPRDHMDSLDPRDPPSLASAPVCTAKGSRRPTTPSARPVPTSRPTTPASGPRKVCGYCGKHCPDSSKLAIHERVHTGEKPFGCSGCDKRFSDRGNAVRHTKTHASRKAVASITVTVAVADPPPDHAAAAGADDDHFGGAAGDTDSAGDTPSGWSSASSTASSSVTGTPVRVLGLPHTVPSRGPVPPGLKPRPKGLNAGNATAKGNAKRPERPPARKHERPHGEKPFGCAFCEKRFTRKVNAAQHERAHRS